MPWSPVEVLVPEGSSRVEVTVTAQEPAGLGMVMVLAHDTSGAAVERAIAIRIEDLDTGAPLLVRDSFYCVTWPYRIDLPAGSYRLVVEGAASIENMHGTVMRAREHGRFETIARVLEGRETMVEAVLPEGARVHVRLAGTVDEEDRKAIRARVSDLDEESLEEWARMARLALLADGRWPEPIWFRWELTGTSAAGTHLTSELALGSDRTSELLPAGRFTIEARLPGGRAVTRPVLLVDGVTTEVDLTFD